MAENTKTPPNQDPRRTPQGDANKPQKPGNPGSSVNNPDRNRQGSNMPGKPGQGQGQGKDKDKDIDPDRNRTSKPMPGSEKPMPGSEKDDDIGVADLDDEDEAGRPPMPQPVRDRQP